MMPVPKASRISRIDPPVGDRLDDVPHVVQLGTVLGDDVAQLALVGRLPMVNRALEVRKVFLGGLDHRLVVLDQDVDHTVRYLEGHGADLFRGVDTEAPALDHGRSAQANRRVLRGDDDVAGRQHDGVSCEAAPGIDAHEGDEAAELRQFGERVGVDRNAATAPASDVNGSGSGVGACCAGSALRLGLSPADTGTAASALGKEHQRQFEASCQFVHPVLLVVPPAALGTGDDHVVIVDDDRARAVRVEQVAVDVANSHD